MAKTLPKKTTMNRAEKRRGVGKHVLWFVVTAFQAENKTRNGNRT